MVGWITGIVRMVKWYGRLDKGYVRMNKGY